MHEHFDGPFELLLCYNNETESRPEGVLLHSLFTATNEAV